MNTFSGGISRDKCYLEIIIPSDSSRIASKLSKASCVWILEIILTFLPTKTFLRYWTSVAYLTKEGQT